MANTSERIASSGSSTLATLPLVDVLQVWSMNRFSGLVAVTSAGNTGNLYFVDGEIVHAEAGDVTGEPAVSVILAWRGAAFEPIPNTTTLKRTVTKRLSHLLLDAHRVIDEQRRAEPTATPPAPAGTNTLDRIRALPGVTQVVRFGPDGRPAPGGGSAGDALAAKSLYLAIHHAGAVATAFGLRHLFLASVQHARESFLIFHSNGNYLAVAIAPGVPVEPLAAQVRGLFARPAAR